MAVAAPKIGQSKRWTHPYGSVAVTWSSVPGNFYRLQYQDNLPGSNWNNAGPEVQATELTTSTTNALGNGDQRYFRVILVQTNQTH